MAIHEAERSSIPVAVKKPMSIPANKEVCRSVKFFLELKVGFVYERPDDYISNL